MNYLGGKKIVWMETERREREREPEEEVRIRSDDRDHNTIVISSWFFTRNYYSIVCNEISVGLTKLQLFGGACKTRSVVAFVNVGRKSSSWDEAVYIQAGSPVTTPKGLTLGKRKISSVIPLVFALLWSSKVQVSSPGWFCFFLLAINCAMYQSDLG